MIFLKDMLLEVLRFKRAITDYSEINIQKLNIIFIPRGFGVLGFWGFVV